MTGGVWKDGVLIIDAKDIKPAFLTPADLEGRQMDRRCVVCLERAYAIFVGYNPAEQIGCAFGHTSKENCHEFAVPHATQRGVGKELKARGLIK